VKTHLHNSHNNAFICATCYSFGKTIFIVGTGVNQNINQN